MEHLRGATLWAFLALALVWGLAFDFISLGLERFSPLLLAALRFDFAFVALLPLALYRRAPLVPRGGAQWGAMFAASVLGIGFYNALLLTGQQHTTASIAAIIIGLNPLLTLVISRAILPEEHVGIKGLVGLALGLVGIVLLATLKGGSLFDARGLGELAVFCAILCWALSSTSIRLSRHGMDVFGFVTTQCLLGAVFLHAFAFAVEPSPRYTWDLASFGIVLYLGVVAVALGYILFFWILDRIGAIRVNAVSYLTPLVATIGGIWMLDQPLEPRGIIAFVLIAAGFFLVARAPHRANPLPLPSHL